MGCNEEAELRKDVGARHSSASLLRQRVAENDYPRALTRTACMTARERALVLQYAAGGGPASAPTAPVRRYDLSPHAHKSSEFTTNGSRQNKPMSCAATA